MAATGGCYPGIRLDDDEAAPQWTEQSRGRQLRARGRRAVGSEVTQRRIFVSQAKVLHRWTQPWPRRQREKIWRERESRGKCQPHLRAARCSGDDMWCTHNTCNSIIFAAAAALHTSLGAVRGRERSMRAARSRGEDTKATCARLEQRELNSCTLPAFHWV